MAELFFFWFGICFICYFVRSMAHSLEAKKRIQLKEKHLRRISVLVFVYWFAWFSMVSLDPFKATLPSWLAYSGLLLFLLGVFFFVWSHKGAKGFAEKEYLNTTGAYSKVRHPIYLGFSFWVVGLPIFTQSIATLASSVIWVLHMAYWARLEEKKLEEKYPQYKEYKKHTWF
ncbi:MAG: hypothetical protein JW772_00915 [Candidatus Diapherotrites archaeon]|nr:hypothetical protein [Candidatus Diapherotrites archaeon]